MFDKLFITLQILRGDFAARFDNEEGATAVEYGLMVALIAVVIIGAVAAIGTNLTTVFQAVADRLVAVN
jgi:pilus assembly protein Flp/PilA